ncbi:MAG: tryptophanase [Saprospiraceae bacterium]|mgnify:FL=1|jgi:tryptophanase|uniref:tryptophanase n=1 Tax=Candidatus Brachybacter algidus TaxID=2982024 RepID=UPI001B7380C2|nr:tryptophanase [Candidatus Brachybacter algidus]MBP7307006.1 tryptophanase [Saprospiraceae bacterium]MBK7605673.1 tryptophanase [Candidatus Brachybacter algidus]MBK8357429.1 tryptophanase [Candidatus Brachybacter algidus]MBK8749017.1 tryptophanase [Candidatus Brachybacter algidus]MBK9023721.1 tryptophanase [Candidatus Brachybacter algidus]
MYTIIEPFRIKSVEPIYFNTKEERIQILEKAFFNLFHIHSKDVLIDLLTDSGTSAMSSNQWAGIMQGDESYAGSPSFFRFEKTIQDITGMPLVIPTHQGRAAEKILFSVLGGKGKYFVSNTLFDTTRANIEVTGAEGVDLLCAEGKLPSVPAPFKGNMDTEALKAFIAEKGAENIPLCIITVTNNSGGGQPVSMENIRTVKNICKENNIPLFIDACRFAENSWFIKQREEGYADKTVKEIAHELFSYAEGCTMSAKKDAFANIGGFLAMHDEDLALQCRNLLIITEGFPTYGGLAGRDLEAIAIGLEEVLDENYLQYRIRSIEYLTAKLIEAGVPVMQPAGGHAVYLDAKEMLPHIPPSQYPAQALAGALFLEGGIRSVEIGSLMFGKYDENKNLIPSRMELVRLAIPRRVYTQSHIDYVAEVIIEVYKNKASIKGLQITEEAPTLRHFTAKLKPIQ